MYSDVVRLLVDGSVVEAAYLVGLEEGIVAGWPRVEDEVVRLVEDLSVPREPGLYFVVGGNRLRHRYVGLVVGGKILLLRVNPRISGETLGRHLSRIYTMLAGYGRRLRRTSMDAKKMEGMRPSNG